MSSIALKQEQYLTYILCDQNSHSRLEVVPERGGIITSWRIQGQDILYLDGSRFANPDLSIRGGIPILFPICGNLPDNVYTYNKKQYILKQHGFARDLPWEVTQQDSQENLASITLSLTSNKQTRAVYPFDFQLVFTYILRGKTLRIEQVYINNSKQTMPFCTGLHPYFWVKDKNNLAFEIPATQYQNQQTQKIQPFTGEFFDLNRAEIDVAFAPLHSNSTSFTDHQRRLQVKINYSELYSTLVFWTVQNKEYVCLEPWSAQRNALNTGENLSYIEPGSRVESWVELVVS